MKPVTLKELLAEVDRLDREDQNCPCPVERNDEGCALCMDRAAMRAPVLSDVARRLCMVAKSLDKAVEIIGWMSGSPSFSPEGEAYEGWKKVQGDLELIRKIIREVNDGEARSS